MRFVLVNDRWPRGPQRYCTLCCEPIQLSYTRDHETRLIYCSPDCAEHHVLVSEAAIERAGRAVA